MRRWGIETGVGAVASVSPYVGVRPEAGAVRVMLFSATGDSVASLRTLRRGVRGMAGQYVVDSGARIVGVESSAGTQPRSEGTETER